MRVLALVAVAGCGRIAFDPLAADGAATCTFGPWGPVVELTPASTTLDDFGPALSSDNLELFFQSGTGPREIYVSTRTSEADPFGPPVLVPALSNPAHEQGPTLSSDDLTLYFGSDRSGAMRLYRSTRPTKSDPFGPPTLVSELANEDCWGPDLSADGSELFYTHDNGTTNEIWRATYSDATGFVVQGPVSELVGSAMFDGYPSISGDGTTLYWQRNMVPVGEIYTASRAGPGVPFGTATLAPFSGTAQDSDPDISFDGRFLVFSSDSGNTGGMDLMMVARDCL